MVNYAIPVRKRPRPKPHKFYPVLSRSRHECDHCDVCNECMAEFQAQVDRDRPGHVWTVVHGNLVYMEDMIAETMLGRPLLPTETVIHKDLNVKNNSRDNLDIITLPNLEVK